MNKNKPNGQKLIKIIKPNIPPDLETADDLPTLIQQARDDETEIENQHFKDLMLSKMDLSRLSFRESLFENCVFTDCSFISTAVNSNRANSSAPIFIRLSFRTCFSMTVVCNMPTSAKPKSKTLFFQTAIYAVPPSPSVNFQRLNSMAQTFKKPIFSKRL